MFNFSSGELLVVGVVSLIVFGPERLPNIAQKLGRWVQLMNHFTDKMKMEIDQQLKLEKLKQNNARAEAAEQNTDGK